VVFLSNILEHLADEELVSTMAELRRVTSVDARVIVLQPNYRYAYKEYFDDYTHVKAFSHVSLVDFFESHGFVPLRIWPKYLPLSMKSVFPKSYWLTRLYLAMPVRPFGKQMLAIFKKKG
jgi:hypothetical protein